MTDASNVPDLDLTRVMGVPAMAIWSAWNEPDSIARWWGPAEFTSTVRELHVADGGRFDVVMHGPDGRDFANVYIFEDVEPGRRVTYVHQGSEEWGLAPSRSVMSIDVEDEDAPTTRVTLRAYYASDEDRRRHLEDFQAAEGARQLLERLEAEAKSR